MPEAGRTLRGAIAAGCAFLIISILPLIATVVTFAATASADWASLALVVTAVAGFGIAVTAAAQLNVRSKGDGAEIRIFCFVAAFLLSIALGVNGVIHLERVYLHWWGTSKTARVSVVQVERATRGVHCRYLLGGISKDQWDDEFPREHRQDRADCDRKADTTIDVVVDPRKRVAPKTGDDMRGIETPLRLGGGLLVAAFAGSIATAGVDHRLRRRSTEALRKPVGRGVRRRSSRAGRRIR